MLEDWLESASGRDSWFRGKGDVVVGEEEEGGGKQIRKDVKGLECWAQRGPLKGLGGALKEALGDEWAVPWALLGHRGLGDFFCMIFQLFINFPQFALTLHTWSHTLILNISPPKSALNSSKAGRLRFEDRSAFSYAGASSPLFLLLPLLHSIESIFLIVYFCQPEPLICILPLCMYSRRKVEHEGTRSMHYFYLSI